MLLGHGAVGQFAVAEALSGLVVNAGTVDVSMGQAATFSIGTETVTGTAVVSQSGTDLGSTFSLGTGEPNFFIWNETDDSETSTWSNVEPGSTD